ncbi:MAG TPA: glycosyltransferase family 4 protein [Tepidisphaeraceae bacterium]|nr:glycosyltransferase family 4 protein [Tepidisphaeraceae bacterium]
MHRRILLLITDLEIGGTPTVVRELALRLRDPARHIHVEVACLRPPGPVADQLTSAGIRVTPLYARGPFDLPRTVHRLNHLLASRLFDTCFSFLLHANAVAAFSSLFLHEVRYIQSIQTTQPSPRWHWTAQRLIHHAARTVVVPTPSVAQAAQSRSHIPADKLIVIPNAVDLPILSPTPRPPGPHRIVFIGRLDPIKRIPDLIASLDHLPPDTELHLYGEGPERANITPSPRVILHGSIPSPAPALANADVLVLPSAAEGFGLVLIEAMAAGVPVVATDVPGIRDVVRHNHTGLLVPVASPPALAAAIQRLRTDDSLRSTLIANARADVAQHFSWPTVIQQYQKLLNIQPEDEE